jgi:hypothetical protein
MGVSRAALRGISSKSFRLYLIAAGVLLVSIQGMLNETRQVRERALALSRNPPALVAIEQFEPARHLGLAGEARVLAQLDLTAVRSVELWGGRGGFQVTVVPLLGHDPSSFDQAATGHPKVLGALLFSGRPEDFDPIRWFGVAQEQGTFGPVVTVHGLSARPELLNRLVQSMLRSGDEGDALLVLRPIEEGGRNVALMSGSADPRLIVAATLMLGFAAFGTFRIGLRNNAVGATGAPKGARYLVDATNKDRDIECNFGQQAIKAAHPVLDRGDRPDLLQGVNTVETVGLSDAEVAAILAELVADEPSVLAVPDTAKRTEAKRSLLTMLQHPQALGHEDGSTRPTPGLGAGARKRAVVAGAGSGKQQGWTRLLVFGTSCPEDVKLSKRQAERLERDPFMQRLSRLS